MPICKNEYEGGAMFKGLSLDQAPPFATVLRFFLTLPWMAAFLGAAIFFTPESMGRWDDLSMVGIVHLAVLGFAATAMVGALFQMLPVIAGATIKDPLYHARWIHALMVLGTLMLFSALYFGKPLLFHPALALLVGSLGFVDFLMLTKLLKVENKTPSVVGMIAALLSLGLGLIFAVAVTLAFMGVDVGIDPGHLRTIHMHFMLFGWIVLLIMAVAFQVIEMFYVTPPYPEMLRRWIPIAMTALLVASVPLYLISPVGVTLIDWVIGLLMAAFAAVTLRRLSQRKRPVADATVMLWRSGMAALLIAVAAGLLFTLTGKSLLFNVAAFGFGYFFFSIIFAMSYKIVPFLVWFHLNAKGVLETPMMGDIVPAKRATWHLWLHWLLGAAIAGALLFSPLWQVVGLLLVAEGAIFGYNLYRAAWLYYKLKDKGMI